jgi:hypothetical protein
LSNFEGETEELSRIKILWSGLSESNRHLNLGKVPYYHYTKAASLQIIYNTPARNSTSPRQLAVSAGTILQDCWKYLRDLPYPYRLYDR